MADKLTACSIDKSTLAELNIFKMVHRFKTHSIAILKAITAYDRFEELITMEKNEICEICGEPISKHTVKWIESEKRYDFRGKCPK